jgi:hypothetical protein
MRSRATHVRRARRASGLDSLDGSFPSRPSGRPGLLFPEFSLGSFHGFEFGLPFFWAIRPEAGLVLTPRYSVKRGPGGAARFDYVAREDSQGEMIGAYYHDLKIDPESQAEPFGRDRWSTRGVHHWSMPADLHFDTNYRFASDNDVPFDFRELESEPRRPVPRVGGRDLALGRIDRADQRRARRHLRRRPPEPRRPRSRPLPAPALADRERRGAARRRSGLPLLAPSLDVEYTCFEARDRAAARAADAPVRRRELFLDTGVDALPNPVAGESRSERGPCPGGGRPLAIRPATTSTR